MDFRGYVQKNAPQYLGYVGNDVNGQGSTGINRGKLYSDFGGPDPIAGTENVSRALGDINNLYKSYSSSQNKNNAPANNNTNNKNNSNYTTGQTQALYDDQIAQLNSILGNIGNQRSQGLSRLEQSALDAKNRLTEQKTKTMQGYDQQSLKNAQDKQRGVEQVDDFANNSYKNLQRVLQGGNAGNSSVGRQLVPQLVSKSAGTRRQGVFNAAGENDASIASARGDAEDQYGYSFQDLENQRKSQQENFLSGIYQQEQDLYGKRAGIEAQKAAATGAGYEGVRAATAGSRAEIDSRAAQLNALFGQFAPTFNAKAVNTKTPDLKSYQIDPALIKGDQSIPQESRFYLPNLKKKEDNQGL